jgi:hypothetical protein
MHQSIDRLTDLTCPEGGRAGGQKLQNCQDELEFQCVNRGTRPRQQNQFNAFPCYSTTKKIFVADNIWVKTNKQ